MTELDRPRIHLTPPAGWMNDPNGMAFVDGRLHLFYQYEPDSTAWGRMRWGHAVSDDVLQWEHLPIALEPRPGGPDEDGCWSGCLVVEGAASPTILYTGVVQRGAERVSSICVATGDDALLTWTQDPTPVIAEPPAGIHPDMFRDPFVWADGDGWAMLVGAGTMDARGLVLLYRSPDLRDWSYCGPLLTTEDVIAACPELDVADIDGPCWECPQLVRQPSGDLLIVSVVDRSPVVRPAHVVAFTGRVSGDRFITREAGRLGIGPDFYAPSTVTTPDGRALLFGWIPEDPPPAGSPRDWAGSLTLPRTVSINDDGSARITLAPEAASIGTAVRSWPEVLVREHAPWTIETEDGYAELRGRFFPDPSAPIRIDITGPRGLAAEIRYDPRSCRLSVARIARVAVAGRDPHGSTILPPSEDGGRELRIILDGSTLEVVCDDLVTATVRLPAVGGGDRRIICSTFGPTCRIVDAELRRY